MYKRSFLFHFFVGLALVCGSSAAHAQQAIINPTGGNNSTDGLRIEVNSNTSFQIYRLGAQQLFAAAGVTLASDAALYSDNEHSRVNSEMGSTSWTQISQSQVSGNGTVASPYQVQTVVSAGSGGHELRLTLSYVMPQDHIDLEVRVKPAAGNTSVLKLYHMVDTFLSGGDEGPAFAQPPTGTPSIVGVTKAGQYEVFIAGNRIWDHYYSAHYLGQYTQVAGANDLQDTLNYDPTTDNGAGVEWILGAVTTEQVIRYRLSFSTTATVPVCGDGAVDGFETCDDGGTASGDGCSNLCQIEDGWSCTGEPSTCSTVCGDGIVAGPEACDDANTAAGDGCNASCSVERGYQCTGDPSNCSTVCGDGIVAGPEACDDANTKDSDGCDASCVVEAGYSCSGEPSVCVGGCGNGVLQAGEACDDGNMTANDGCDATCSIERGYDCMGQPSSCVTVCGDGLIAGAEACDDGNTAAGDGCNAGCAVETDWVCTNEPSTCKLDSDRDGIVDSADNCPMTANRDQADVDRDGIGDACDADANGDGFADELGVRGGGCSAASGGSGLGAALLIAGAVFLFAWGFGRRRFGVIGGAAALIALGSLGEAAAQSSLPTNYPVERFRLATTRDGILDVESAAVAGHMQLDVAVWLGYADDPLNVYRRTGGAERDRVGSLVSSRLGGTLLGSVGLFDRGQLALAAPLIVRQSSDSAGAMLPTTDLSGFGLGDVRLIPKVALLQQRTHGVDLAAIAGFTLPTSTSADYVGDTKGSFAPELALSRGYDSGLRLAANVGYRARGQTMVLDLVVDDEVFTHLGAAYRLPKLPLELNATVAAATAPDSFGTFNRTYSEVKTGAAYDVTPFARVFAVAGVGTSEGFGTPDWRAGVGLRFNRALQEPRRLLAKSVDSDGDGLADSADRCPEEPETRNGVDDHDGCPDQADRDGDGLADNVDQCPGEPEDVDRFEDTDGCPDLDNDKDGIADLDDQCINDPGIAVLRGCPDRDRDGDTVVDRLDNCPDEAGSPENHGCEKKQLVKITDQKIDILEIVHFRVDNDVILPKSFGMLDNVARVIKSHPDISLIRIEGHTDSQGSDAHNKDLSRRRAQAVMDYLVKQGVDASRLEAVGHGEEKPVADNDTAAGRAANRRVEFTILRR